ncbi:LysR family transcriptional regulator [Ochrobactrum sp. EDr1-4]|uniref:LysR family transcriptional regulator n=1 Tax=Ochrobactrum sp. EDr1-4 TaxID=3368622 RepID=UPI003B9F62CB
MFKTDHVRDFSHVNLKLINTFVCVADIGSFHRAADVLGRTQSAVSMQIKELESQLGFPLFVRTTRQLELTIPGRMLLDQSRASISSIAAALRCIQDERNFRGGHIRIACSPTYAAASLPRVIKAFKEEYPTVKVSIGEYKSAEILNALKQDKADFGVGPELSDPEMTFELGRTEPLLAVVPKGWLDDRSFETITLKELLVRPLVMFYPNTVVHKIISAAAQQIGVPVKVEYYCIQGETLLAFANAGLAIAILTGSIANLSHIEDCKVLRIVEPELLRRFTMITRKGAALMPEAKYLYQLIIKDISQG